MLTIQLALRLPNSSRIQVISRVNPGDLSACCPSVSRHSSETLELHRLFNDADETQPATLSEIVRGSRILSALGGPDTRVRPRLLELGAAAVYSFDPQPEPGARRHIIEQWQTRLEAQGLLIPKCTHQRPNQRGLAVPDRLRAHGQEMLARLGCDRDALVIHPGSGGRWKCWPLALFVNVARRLSPSDGRATEYPSAVQSGSRARLRPVFMLGPVELETWPPTDIQALESEFPVLRAPAPDEMIAILAAARAFVGNDAGPTHLAALLGVPAVAIFGPTSELIWRPRGPACRVLQGDPERPRDDWTISPDNVLAALRELL